MQYSRDSRDQAILVRDIQAFGWAILKHWRIVAGAIVGDMLLAFAAGFGATIPPVVYGWILVVGVTVATFRAWRDQHNLVRQLDAEIEDLKRTIGLQALLEICPAERVMRGDNREMGSIRVRNRSPTKSAMDIKVEVVGIDCPGRWADFELPAQIVTVPQSINPGSSIVVDVLELEAGINDEVYASLPLSGGDNVVSYPSRPPLKSGEKFMIKIKVTARDFPPTTSEVHGSITVTRHEKWGTHATFHAAIR